MAIWADGDLLTPNNLNTQSVTSLAIADTFLVSGAGPHVIGGTTLDYVRIRLTGNFTSLGGSTQAAGVRIDGQITGADGDTAFITQVFITPNTVTQTATENIAVISSLRVEEPVITDNLTGDITVAATVHIFNAPTEGESNYALWVDDGNIRSDGVFIQNTVTTLADDATPTVAASNLFKTGGVTTITDFDDGVVGQTIKILAAHSVKITDGAPIILAGGADYDMTVSDTLTLTMYDDQVWQEDSRSVN